LRREIASSARILTFGEQRPDGPLSSRFFQFLPEDGVSPCARGEQKTQQIDAFAVADCDSSPFSGAYLRDHHTTGFLRALLMVLAEIAWIKT
jgi:hypothetical protein